MEEKHEKEYREEVLNNKDVYPNLYNIEIKKNRWSFKKDFKNKNFNK